MNQKFLYSLFLSLALVSCSSLSADENDSIIAIHETGDQSGVPFISLKLTNGESKNFFVDTGAPTFVLDIDKVSNMNLEWDGTGTLDFFDGSTRVVNYIKFLHLKAENDQFTAKYGYATHLPDLEGPDVFGLLNPSQLAHDGCIYADFVAGKIYTFKYSDKNPESCKYFSSRQSIVTLNHKYFGTLQLNNRPVSVLIDTGYGISVMSASLPECRQEYAIINNRQANLITLNGSMPLFSLREKERLVFPDNTERYFEVGVCQLGALPSNVDIVLGYDFLKDYGILVGRDIRPRVVENIAFD